MKKLRITIGDKSYEVTVEVLADDSRVSTSATHPVMPAAAQAPLPLAATPAAPRKAAGAGSVVSPLAGQVKKVLVKPGDRVEVNQTLIILEAMKMENQVAAPLSGTVKNVGVAEGESVLEGHVLVVLE